MDYSYYVRKYFCQICKFKVSWGVSKIVKFTYFCDLTWPFCTKISLMPSLGLYRQISNFFFCISSFDAKTSMYAKNHENLGHGMCHPLPGFSLDGLLRPPSPTIHTFGNSTHDRRVASSNPAVDELQAGIWRKEVQYVFWGYVDWIIQSPVVSEGYSRGLSQLWYPYLE